MDAVGQHVIDSPSNLKNQEKHMKKQLDKTSARQVLTTRHMIFVLGISTVLAIIALAAVTGFF